MNENAQTTAERLQESKEARRQKKEARKENRAETASERQGKALEAWNAGLKRIKEMADRMVEGIAAAPEAIANTFDDIADFVDGNITEARVWMANKDDELAEKFNEKSNALFGRIESFIQTKRSEFADGRAKNAEKKAKEARDAAEKVADANRKKAEAIMAEAQRKIQALESDTADTRTTKEAAAQNFDKAATEATMKAEELRDDAEDRKQNARTLAKFRARFTGFIKSA